PSPPSGPAPRRMDTDRNLLFAVLAHQAGLLDPAQFVEACTVWAAGRDRPLADLLVERGWLAAADRGHLDCLVARRLERDGGDARASLAAVAGPDVRDALATVSHPTVQASVSSWPAFVGSALRPAPPITPEPGGRYARLRVHAAGGLGRVWLAQDRSLGREVAVKELQGDPTRQPALRARVVEEARITGQLEHPNIVPVYELSDPPDGGAPFYAMRFVRGQTLAAAVRDFHRGPDPAADRLGLRRLLGAVVAVGQAV